MYYFPSDGATISRLSWLVPEIPQRQCNYVLRSGSKPFFWLGPQVLLDVNCILFIFPCLSLSLFAFVRRKNTYSSPTPSTGSGPKLECGLPCVLNLETKQAEKWQSSSPNDSAHDISHQHLWQISPWQLARAGKWWCYFDHRTQLITKRQLLPFVVFVILMHYRVRESDERAWGRPKIRSARGWRDGN